MFAASKTAAVSSAANYIEDVFSTYLYTGNGSTQTITNGIDLSTKGGLVWIKCRNSASDHSLEDTLRTVSIYAATINSNTTSAQSAGDITGFTTSGFSLRDYTGTTNANEDKYVSWTLRKQPKFFDVVTWTGDDSANRQISHSLGSVPGCIMVKRTDASATWRVWHQNMVSNPANLYQYQLNLNNTNAVSLTYGEVWGTSNNVTSTTFQVGSLAAVNASGGTYVAYVFAHNAGGFGLTGTDNVISCGSFTTDGSGNATVSLGYEPQWIMAKASSGTVSDWFMYDNMRGLDVSNGVYLRANSTAPETAVSPMKINATGFSVANSTFDASSTYIYIAIRRGPMKVPTDATKVFAPVQYTSATTPPTVTTGFPVDMIIDTIKGPANENRQITDRLRGSNINLYRLLYTNSNVAEQSSTFTNAGYDLASNTSTRDGFYGTVYGSGYNCITWNFRRAPNFMDEVCYTGTGTPTNFTHNLGVVPELMIVKRRDSTSIWAVYAAPLASAATSYLELSEVNAVATGNTVLWNSTAPTSTVFTIGSSSNINTNGSTNVAYLFATCAGVSKVGSYTGTGSTQTISCDFTGGARFVLIKRTDSTGDWWVWDTSRGMVSGTDPRLALNIQTGESTGNWVYTTTGGFQIVTTDASVNASGGTYIFLAIA